MVEDCMDFSSTNPDMKRRMQRSRKNVSKRKSRSVGLSDVFAHIDRRFTSLAKKCEEIIIT
jgi:hypothetical protein